jgi:hypothetical protein
MSVSIGDGGTSKASIVADMQRREDERMRRLQGLDDTAADVARFPIPTDKPRRDAQWDEAAGRWEVWSEAEGGWVSLEDGSVQEPGTRSVVPHEEGVTRPPPIDLH